MKPKPLRKIDIQGHRGCRGLLPENTIPAFLKALELGVTTLELDTVISKDKQVVVSHEPFMNPEICLKPDGSEIVDADAKSFNLYQLTYSEIQQFDCGRKVHPRFPEQQKMAVYKPLLSGVIDAAEAFKNKLQKPVFYNIETKSTPAGDNLFHPEPEEFVDLLIGLLLEKKVLNRCIIQSFDVRTLLVIHRKYPAVRLALLVEEEEDPEVALQQLDFTPAIYSPDFVLITDKLLRTCQAEKIDLIPWTVNEPDDIRQVLSLPVAGLITDYPERAIAICKEMGVEVL